MSFNFKSHVLLSTALSALIFLPILSNASELDELATTQRLLDQVQLSLDRARTVAAQSDPNNRRRYLFDYKKATIPCRPDIRQLRFEVQHTRISNPALAAELQDFTNDCYALALYLWKQQDQGQTKEEDTLRDVEWLGSSTFLNGSGYYDQLQSKTPRASFPWNESRDSGRPDTGRGGYPTCREWWSSADIGLEARVVDQASPGMWLRMSAALKMMGKDNTEYKESIVRRLVSPESLTVSQNGRTYAGYGGNADFTLDNSASRIGGIAGMSLGSLAAFPAFDAMRQALPMVQALLLMAIYVMLPLILAFGSYEFKTVITVSFVVFALNFLTFW